jgi:hypothetical protein
LQFTYFIFSDLIWGPAICFSLIKTENTGFQFHFLWITTIVSSFIFKASEFLNHLFLLLISEIQPHRFLHLFLHSEIFKRTFLDCIWPKRQPTIKYFPDQSPRRIHYFYKFTELILYIRACSFLHLLVHNEDSKIQYIFGFHLVRIITKIAPIVLRKYPGASTIFVQLKIINFHICRHRKRPIC